MPGPYQTGHGVIVAYKVQSGLGVPASGAGATVFRANPSGGIKMNRPSFKSNEIRADGKSSMGRLGSKTVAGSYAADMSVGTFDALIEACLRGTWTAQVAITQATTLNGSAAATSVTTGAHTIVAAAGSWITQGVRVGDIIRLTGFPDGANNQINVRVTGVTALTLTVAETLVVNGTPDTTFTVTILKKLVQPTVPVQRYFTIEEYNQDMDLTKRTVDVVLASIKLTGQPNGMAIIEFGFVGTDQTPLASGASPNFTSPTLTTAVALTWLDAAIRLKGVDRVDLTAFEATFDNHAKGVEVIGSNNSPDIFPDNADLDGSFSALQSDMQPFADFVAETEVEFLALLVAPMSEPKDCISLFISRVKYTNVDEQIGQSGPKIVNLPFMTGTKGAGVSGYDDTMLSVLTSAP
ncbi:MAG TPA: phage tail tube protein [Reyranella sp.]|nr:phage tail tube protein [Reyranella sp.]